MTESEKSAVHINKVCAAYDGEVVLKDIDLDIPKGSIQIIIGPSGSGKSTLLKLMNGLLCPVSGLVEVLDKKVCQGRCCRKNIGYIPQNLGLIRTMTVMQNILMGALARTKTLSSLFNSFSDDDLKLAEHLIEVVALSGKIDAKVSCLSGGEKRRVAIARAFMQRPKILLADEILSDLDFVQVQKITDELKKLQEEFGVTIVMVEHDIKVVRSIGERIMILRDGQTQAHFQGGHIDDADLYQYFTGSSSPSTSSEINAAL